MTEDEMLEEVHDMLGFGTQIGVEHFAEHYDIPLSTLAGLASGELVAVPREPTPRMTLLGKFALDKVVDADTRFLPEEIGEVYRAMIEAWEKQRNE